MSKSDTGPAPVPGFWRCDGCGTFNPSAAYVTLCLGCGAPRAIAAARPTPRPAPDGPAGAPAPAPRPPRRGGWLLGASWVYAAVVLLVLVLMRWVGEEEWVVAALLFMPRWVWLGPVLALGGLAGLSRNWRALAVQAATLAVVAGPLMGLSVPFRTLWESAPAGDRVRVATLNVGASALDLDALFGWLDRERVDVLCMQELSKDPALADRLAKGWHLNRDKTVASRLPVVEELESLPNLYDSEQRFSSQVHRVRLKTKSGKAFVVVSLHLPTLRYGFKSLAAGKPAGLTLHLDWWGREMARVLALLGDDSTGPVVVAGDFNMPADDPTMAALRRGFQFAFDEAGWGYGYTRPAKLPWVRIDHIMAGPEWTPTACRLGPNVGSDHLPVVAELVLPETVGAVPPIEPRPAPSGANDSTPAPGMPVAPPAGRD